MDMQGALRARVLADPTVAAKAGTRVYWGVRPQGEALPAVVLNVISEPHEFHLKGPNDFRASRVQVDALASSYGDALKIAEALIVALVQPNRSNGVVFQHADAEGPRNQGEDTAGGFVHRHSSDFLIRHRMEG